MDQHRKHQSRFQDFDRFCSLRLQLQVSHLQNLDLQQLHPQHRSFLLQETLSRDLLILILQHLHQLQ